MRQIKISESITRRNEESVEPFLAEISKEQMITPEEEADLAREIHKGNDQALDKLVRANLRFVVSVAKFYQNQGLGLSDLISEGNLGLIQAARKFDETRGFKFISYAVWWIRQSIIAALNEQARFVRIPGSQNAIIRRIKMIQNRYEQEENRPPTIEEIADELNLEPSQIKVAIASLNRNVSLDSPLQEEEGSTLMDVTPDTGSEPTDSKLENESLQKDLEIILSLLKERESLVLRKTFGLDGRERSQEEIAVEMGLTRERVRQIRDLALSKIRKSPSARTLMSYL